MPVAIRCHPCQSRLLLDLHKGLQFRLSSSRQSENALSFAAGTWHSRPASSSAENPLLCCTPIALHLRSNGHCAHACQQGCSVMTPDAALCTQIGKEQGTNQSRYSKHWQHTKTAALTQPPILSSTPVHCTPSRQHLIFQCSTHSLRRMVTHHLQQACQSIQPLCNTAADTACRILLPHLSQHGP